MHSASVASPSAAADVVDKAKLDQMLFNLRGYLDVLRGLAAIPRGEFLGNPDKIGNAK